MICLLFWSCTQSTSQPPRNLPYSTFLPSSSNHGTLQSLTVNRSGVPAIQTVNSKTLPNNRLSYIGTNVTPTSIASSVVNLPSPSVNLSPNGINTSPYVLINNSTSVSSNPSGISFSQGTPNGVEQMRSTALVKSYISSLNNAVSYQITLLTKDG